MQFYIAKLEYIKGFMYFEQKGNDNEQSRKERV